MTLLAAAMIQAMMVAQETYKERQFGTAADDSIVLNELNRQH